MKAKAVSSHCERRATLKTLKLVTKNEALPFCPSVSQVTPGLWIAEKLPGPHLGLSWGHLGSPPKHALLDLIRPACSAK